MYFYRKTILINIEIRIDNINSVYFSFLFFIIQAITIYDSFYIHILLFFNDDLNKNLY